MKNKCIQCGNEKFEKGFLGTNLYVVFMNDKLSTFAKLISQGGKRVYAQECTNCGYLIMSTKKDINK